MPIIDDPRVTETALAGGIADNLFDQAAQPDAAPGALDILAAAARQSNTAAAAYERFANPNPIETDTPPNFDPFDHIQGFESDAHRFVEARSPSEVEGIKQRILQQRADRDVLHRAGWGGTFATLGYGLIDPAFLASAAVPELAIAKLSRLGAALNAAAKGTAGAVAYEGAMRSLNNDRTLPESALNIGAGALLAGTLGSLVRHVPPEDLASLRQGIAEDLAINPNMESTAGAAAVVPQMQAAPELERIATSAGRGFMNAAGKIPWARTDLQEVLASDSPLARFTLQQLSDVSPVLEKNLAGVATPTSVEALVQRHEGRVADFSDFAATAYAKYRARMADASLVHEEIPLMSKKDFYAAIAGAARTEDQHLTPEVQSASRYLRARVFDPLKQEAQALNLLPENVQVIGAPSYFRRMYDRAAIRADRPGWDGVLIEHFLRKGVTRMEAVAAAEDVTAQILGHDIGQSNFMTRVQVPQAGPLVARTLDVPDQLIQKFLVNDPMKVAQAYVRDLAPQIEVTKVFGDKNMESQFQHIADQYNAMRERIRSSGAADAAEKITALEEQQKRTLEALVRIRDRIYGRAGRLSPDASEGHRLAAAGARGWRNLVASAKLGAATITSIPQDLAAIVAKNGFAPTISKLVKLASSSDFRAISKGRARAIGAAIDVAMSRRITSLYGGELTEGWTQHLAEGLYKYSCLSHWTDLARTLSATLIEDKIIAAAQHVAAGGELDTVTRARLASLGLDADRLRGIAAAVAQHGENFEGVRMSNSARWRDGDLAAAFDAAVLKESHQTVLQPGAADRPWWVDKELGKTLGQLKAFNLASLTRYTMQPIQQAALGNYGQAARLIGFMMIGGYLAHSFRQLAAGKLPDTTPSGALGEAFSESALGGVIPDMVAPLGRRFGLVGESAKYSDSNVMSAFGGPALGTLGDAYDLAMNRTSNGLSANDLHALRRLLPYQNLWYLRRAINGLEGVTADEFDLKGAEHKGFWEYASRTDALAPSKQRGGTGTGMPSL